MLMTDVGDVMCWRQLWDHGDAFGRVRRQHSPSFNISVGHQHPKDVTNIEIMSPIMSKWHQSKIVTNIRSTTPACHHHLWSNQFHFRRDEKEIFVDGKPTDNWLKNFFNSEYTMGIMDIKFVTEKGFFHIFGELFTSEISFIRNDAPDKTACALSLGKEAGKSTCPEQEKFSK